MTKDKANDSKIENMTFEEARDELKKVVEKLQAGSTTLQESLELWERGEKLAKFCSSILENAEKKIDQLDDQNK